MKPHRRKHRRPTRLLKSGLKSARDMIGTVEPGERVCGLTGGQFSLIDILFLLLEQSGPASVVVSSWTVGNADADTVKRAQNGGKITSILWLLDRSFPSRQPGYADKMARLYGAESLRVTRTHAKFLIVDGGRPGSRFVVQTSMNMNSNKRMESFDITEGDDIADHYTALVDAVWTEAVPGLSDSAGSRDVLARVLDGDGDLASPWKMTGLTDNAIEGLEFETFELDL